MKAKALALAILYSTALISLAACGQEGEQVLAVRGRNLELHIQRPVVTDRVAFLDEEGQHRLIKPRGPDRILAAVHVTIINRTTTLVPLFVDTEAAQLGDRRGERIFMLDPFEASQVVATQDPEEGRFAPLLWGNVELDKGFQVAGWLIFDVPRDLRLWTLWWNEADDVVADFVDYRRFK